jgi:hypothetical protein
MRWSRWAPHRPAVPAIGRPVDTTVGHPPAGHAGPAPARPRCAGVAAARDLVEQRLQVDVVSSCPSSSPRAWAIACSRVPAVGVGWSPGSLFAGPFSGRPIGSASGSELSGSEGMGRRSSPNRGLTTRVAFAAAAARVGARHWTERFARDKGLLDVVETTHDEPGLRRCRDCFGPNTEASRTGTVAVRTVRLGPGSTFAGYRIESLLGRGGMGVVYEATDLSLDRPVALKLIAPELADDQRFRERFLAEPRLAASLDHANVVPIYEAGEHDGQLYLAMRYVQGSDLNPAAA